MKKPTLFIFGLFVCSFVLLFLSANETFAQSTQDDYSYAYDYSNEEVASIAADRLFERGYTVKKTSQTVDVNKKGCAIILQSSYTNAAGEKITVHSTATGCKDMEEAKKIALKKLENDNPLLKPNSNYTIVAKYVNK